MFTLKTTLGNIKDEINLSWEYKGLDDVCTINLPCEYKGLCKPPLGYKGLDDVCTINLPCEYKGLCKPPLGV